MKVIGYQPQRGDWGLFGMAWYEGEYKGIEMCPDILRITD
jgi:hypothetical protein